VRAGVRVSALAQARTSVCARVALLIQHPSRRHIAIFGLSDSTIFFDIISQGHDFRKKKKKIWT
jgi:hypothetical protein